MGGFERRRWRRVLLKISGEALKGRQDSGIDYGFVHELARELRETIEVSGVELALVVGGGNFIRGAETTEIERAVGDYMGMLATMINAMALQAVFEKEGLQTRVLSALEIREVAESYIRRRAIRHLEKGRIVIFACGTGNPFFTTDTAAALRAAEINAEVILKATNVDGVYSADPKRDRSAQRFQQISFSEALARNLRVMDATAISLCRDNHLPIVVYNLHEPGNTKRAILGEEIGTLVGGE